MAENKTKATNHSVSDFIATIADAQKRADCETIIKMMTEATKAPAKMWGTAIIGFGDTHLKYESGRELDWFLIGFSPRKKNIALYMNSIVQQHETILKTLGEYKTGKGCIYIQKMSDVNAKILKELIKLSIQK